MYYLKKSFLIKKKYQCNIYTNNKFGLKLERHV